MAVTLTKLPSQGVGSTVEVSEIESLSKGSLIAGDGTGAPSTLAVGTDNFQLVADAAEATGLKWLAQALTLVTSGTFSATATPFNLTGLTSRNLFVLIVRTTSGNSNDTMQLQLNGDTGANYSYQRLLDATVTVATAGTGLNIMNLNSTGASVAVVFIPTGSNTKNIVVHCHTNNGGTHVTYLGGQHAGAATTVTAIKAIIPGASTYTGAYALYYVPGV